ncbi:heterokaryon incompatibility protein-domain-containing protein [Podospora didyma]|uniref:Heterokaryon incompatibility protein-domain-containing protein n=1 Tax=Podospora didyma TaxID=330526 RepID=A0AAE0N4X3_9PEZI|nr:heterokaryon incompatibility protein-domain-containing protein [Podospora didyma]
MEHKTIRQPGFPYSPIQSPTGIRLLLLLPHCDPGAAVECQLLEVRHYQDRTYVALSYVWGEYGEPSPTILLEGHAFQVTPNLHTALKHFRHNNRPRLLWVDAICINQGDDEEKSEQVSRMQLIYRSAYTVLMWAGPKYQDSDSAMGILLGVESIFEATGRPGDYYSGPAAIREKLVSAVAADQHGTAIKAFFDRSYWHRVWILQEAVSGSKSLLCCGDYGVTWSAVSRTVLDAKRVFWLIIGQLRSRESLHEVIQVTEAFGKLSHHADLTKKSRLGVPIPFLDGLIASRTCGASDVRDHIYGILSIVSNVDVQVDYSKPAFQLYIEVTRDEILRSGNLDILSACRRWDSTQLRQRFDPLVDPLRSWIDSSGESARLSYSPLDAARAAAYSLAKGSIPSLSNMLKEELGRHTLEGLGMAWLPSWVPRWDLQGSSAREALAYESFHRMKGYRWHTVPGTVPRCQFKGIEDCQLVLSGIKVDIIYSMTTAWGYGSFNSQQNAFYCMVASNDDDAEASEEQSSYRQRFNNEMGWENAPLRNRPVNPATRLEELRSEANIIMKWTRNILPLNFFVTEQGFMGLYPRDLESGDVVCVLFGGRAPFILRPSGDGIESFHLIGEVMSMLEAGRVVRREFNLI